ncbi:MAG TPA: YcnI family protein [Micromonosporaceae bacterium]
MLGFAAPASAHVTVNSDTAQQGGYAKLTFRVPNEKDAANTVKVEVDLPQDTPIASVSVKPVAGWTADVQMSKLASPLTDDDGAQVTEAVSKIVWTAGQGSAIGPGQFQEFDISAGPLPDADQIVFKALQYYSDGDIVRWIDEPSPGVAEADLEHPAPTLKLTSAAAESTTGGSSNSVAGAALGLGIAGVVLGLAGLALGLFAYRRLTATR